MKSAVLSSWVKLTFQITEIILKELYQKPWNNLGISHFMNNFSFSLDYKMLDPKYRRALVVVVFLYLPVLNIHSHTPNPNIGFKIEKV